MACKDASPSCFTDLLTKSTFSYVYVIGWKEIFKYAVNFPVYFDEASVRFVGFHDVALKFNVDRQVVRT